MLKRIPSDRREQLPHILKDALGYEFFEGVDGGRELPLDPSFGSGEAYRRQIYFLAEDIADLINKLKQKDASEQPADVASKPTVYLSESSYDLRDEREKIRGDLRAHGYTVLPDQLARLPELESEYVAEVGVAGSVPGLRSLCRQVSRQGAGWSKPEVGSTNPKRGSFAQE